VKAEPIDHFVEVVTSLPGRMLVPAIQDRDAELLDAYPYVTIADYISVSGFYAS
jgi:hypothetical protein